MRKLTYAMNLSLDGYIAAPDDDLGWGVPGSRPRTAVPWTSPAPPSPRRPCGPG